jgi:hypothetical protein
VNTGRPNFLGHLHQAQRFSIAFGTRHAEVAQAAFLGVAALLMAEHHAGLSVEAGQTADDRLVVRESAVAVQFLEVGEDLGHVVERVGALRMTRDLGHLPRRQARVDVLRQQQALLAETIDLLGDVDRGFVLHVTQLFDLRFELGDRLLEVEEMTFAHRVGSGGRQGLNRGDGDAWRGHSQQAIGRGSRLRQMYHVATERKGDQASPTSRASPARPARR